MFCHIFIHIEENYPSENYTFNLFYKLGDCLNADEEYWFNLVKIDQECKFPRKFEYILAFYQNGKRQERLKQSDQS